MAAPVLIKKYGNRRLYDTEASHYITLDELAAKIRTGAEVRVVDAKTSEDLTQATLTQLILEGGSARLLPVGLLTQMIRLGDDALGEFFSRYVTAALDLYLQAKRGVQQLGAYNPLSQLPLAATDALQRLWMANPFAAGFGGGPPPAGYGYPSPAAPPPTPPDDPPRGPRSDDVADLRRELEELKQAMRQDGGLGRPGAKRKPKKD